MCHRQASLRFLRTVITQRLLPDQSIELPGKILRLVQTWIGIQKAAMFMFDCFGKGRGIHSKHLNATGLGFDEIQAQSFLFWQSGQHAVEIGIHRSHIRLMSPEPNPLRYRR